MIDGRRLAQLLLLANALLPLCLNAGSTLDDLAITVKGRSREFSYTNKVSAFYYGETSLENRTAWQGFNVSGHTFLSDYALIVEGQLLRRQSALLTIVYPDYLKRTYPGGISEEVRIADSIPAFGVVVRSPRPIELGIIPYLNDGWDAADFTTQFKDGMVLLARNAHLTRTDQENYPVWMAIHGRSFSAIHKESQQSGAYALFQLQSVRRQRDHAITIAVADNADEAARIAVDYLDHMDSYAMHRRERLEALVTGSQVKTKEKSFDKALAWAKISLDALIMNQVTKGIFAGLPWFNNYWGRDTFISLPGATLVTGRFGEAKEILRAFAEFQQTDSTSTDYGRIPNLVTTSEKAYNTADGTPRFIIMAKEYVERSGDSLFLSEIYPTVIRSIEGSLKYHVDRLGFLTHGEAETWMDAVGPDGPWSPRGNRANDIQAVWAQELGAGLWFATRVGDVVSARRWYNARELIRNNFAKSFVTNGIVTDHLKSDGSVDNKVRPNQIFVSPLVDDSLFASVVRTVVNELTYEYGVASLSQNDEDFHPFHQYLPYYPKDAAYHNGTVWTWLQGPLISQLCHFGKHKSAWVLTANSVHQILDRGAVGSQSELLDAVPRPGEKEPHTSGTFSQAWNLAEFVRNFYDDYLGIRTDLLTRTVILQPRLPYALGKTGARIGLGKEWFDLEVEQRDDFSLDASITPHLRKPLMASIRVESEPGKAIFAKFEIIPGSSTRLQLNKGKLTFYADGRRAQVDSKPVVVRSYDHLLGHLRFVTPMIRKGLKALRGPDYELLGQKEVKASNLNANLLIDCADPVGDDAGTGSYSYPRNSAFRGGCFDITHFTASYDHENAYFVLKFRNLSDPGWHPEYGFQLTFVGIAIDQDGVNGSGAGIVKRNANFLLPDDRGYERIIFVGGGIQVEDSAGRILAAYVPADSDRSNPLGNARLATITFSLPLRYLGTPTKNWRFAVLAGAQDDHGGGGIGEFRTVNKETGEWNGGGRKNPGEPNVYDVLMAPAR